VKWFDYAAPVSIEEATRLLAENPLARPLAGGTDLLVQLRSGRKDTGLVIDVKQICELNEIQWSAAGMTLGAAVPCYRIYRDTKIARDYPALMELAGIIGGTQIQGRASFGGNLCNSAPSADAIPLLIAMGATCQIASQNGRRQIQVEDFCTAPGTNVLRPGELLVAINIPPVTPNSGVHYLRFTPRNEMDIAVAGVGVKVVLNDGHFVSVRIALASLAPTPLFVREAGDSLAGTPVSEATIAVAASLARAAAQPISDMRGTADYRRHLCAVLTRRALEVAVQRAKV
jgi:carbon-monoxide dehydrogenase medium subunit